MTASDPGYRPPKTLFQLFCIRAESAFLRAVIQVPVVSNLLPFVSWPRVDTRKYIVFEDKKRKKKGEKKYKIRNKKLEEYFHIEFGKEQLEYEFESNARRAERDQNERSSYEWTESTDEFFDFTIGENGTVFKSVRTGCKHYESEEG